MEFEILREGQRRFALSRKELIELVGSQSSRSDEGLLQDLSGYYATKEGVIASDDLSIVLIDCPESIPPGWLPGAVRVSGVECESWAPRELGSIALVVQCKEPGPLPPILQGRPSVAWAPVHGYIIRSPLSWRGSGRPCWDCCAMLFRDGECRGSQGCHLDRLRPSGILRAAAFGEWTLREAAGHHRAGVWVLGFVALAAASLRMAAPLVLSGAIAVGADAGPTRPLWLRLLPWVLGYVLVLAAGRALQYAFLILHGRIEQVTQSAVLEDGLRSYLGHGREVQATTGREAVAFAIDAQGGAFREGLSAMLFTVVPSCLGAVVGGVALGFVAGLATVVVLVVAVAVDLLLVPPLMARHQESQGAFFEASLRSFGQLERGVAMWKEAFVFGAERSLAQCYRSGRSVVEERGLRAYRATRRLYLVQEGVMAVGLLVALMTVIMGQEPGAAAVSEIVAVAGVWLAAFVPLLDLGFGVSTLATQEAAYAKARATLAGEPASFALLRILEAPRVRLVVTRDGGDGTAERHSCAPGRPIWVRGPSGGGKTTLLERVVGLRPVDEGLVVELERPRGDTRPVWSYAQQAPALLDGTTTENVCLDDSVDPQLARTLVEAMGLGDLVTDAPRGDAHVGDDRVSGGEARRISVARALARDTSVVVLDEPTAGLDQELARPVWDWIERAARTRVVIVATHDPAAPTRDGDLVIRCGD